MTVWTVEVDGACRGNPGPAAYGFVVRDPSGQVRYAESGYIGSATNNVAEYRALIHALAWLRWARIRTVVVYTDSLLLVRQVQGQFRVQSKHLRSLLAQVQTLLRWGVDWQIQHRSRWENRLADRLARDGLRRALRTKRR